MRMLSFNYEVVSMSFLYGLLILPVLSYLKTVFGVFKMFLWHKTLSKTDWICDLETARSG